MSDNKSYEDRALDLMKHNIKEYNWAPHLNNKAGVGGSNCLHGSISRSDEIKVFSYACHRHIEEHKKAMVLWNAFGYRTSKEAAEAYFNWLNKNSPWSINFNKYLFISNNPFEDQGWVFTKPNKTPANMLHNFLIATRMAAEWPEWIESWYKLTQKGINSALAFLLLTCFSSTNGHCPFTDKTKSLLTVSEFYDWPLTIYTATEDYVRNFIVGEPIGRLLRKFYPSANTKPVNTLWGELAENDIGRRYVTLLGNLYLDKLGTDDTYKSFGDEITRKVFTSESLFELAKLEQERLGL